MWAAGEDYDVVVVGFGTAGATAALEAVRAGARVLVLDRRGVRVRPAGTRRGALRLRLPFRAHRRSAVPALSDLRAAALAAGVEVRRQTAVHELVVEGGRVTGVGYAAVDPRSASGARYWWLDRLSAWTPRLSAGLAATLRRAAESVWHDASSVGTVSASSVVLGTARAQWDFVGPAVWAAGVAEAATHRPGGTAVRRRLSLVGEGTSAPTPELEVRAWCARETGAGACSEALAELRVDPATGQLSVGDAGDVPGLYAAVAELTGPAPVLAEDGALLVAAGRRAGRAAAVDQPRRGHLRSVG